MKRLLPIECVTLLYTLFTAVLIVLNYSEMPEGDHLLLQRVEIVGVMGLLFFLNQRYPRPFTRLLRTLFPLSLLGYWYPDTFDFCSLFPNLDHVFAQVDQWMFGMQPSIRFAEVVPASIFSEAFYLGYFSYYPMIFLTCLLPFILYKRSIQVSMRKFEQISFVVVVAFYLYYLIYLFLPVAGPQFYFPVIGEQQALHGEFSKIGYYFAEHPVLHHVGEGGGFFESIIRGMQQAGERPTAAFPSSHVGMSTVLMLLLYKQSRYAVSVAAPFYVLLCASTVYIRAHYFVDVLGGGLTAIVFYWLVCSIYRLMYRQRIGEWQRG